MFKWAHDFLSCIKRKTVEYDWEIEGSFRVLYESVPIGFAVNDLTTGRFLRANPAFCEIVGYSEAELQSMTYWDLTPIDYATNEQDQIDSMEHGGSYGPYEKTYIHSNGSQIPVMLSGVAIRNENGKDTVWSVAQDITEIFDARLTIHDLAYFDQLTGLPNRTHFITHAQVLLNRADERNSGCALFVVDVDDFKNINDSLGHSFGDRVLIMVAEQLSNFQTARCSSTSGCKCFCARLGGDEFAIMIENADDVDNVNRVADELVCLLNEPIALEGRSLAISASIGISVYPEDGHSVTSLLKSADLALYVAKESGKNQHHIHDKSLTARFEEFFRYESILRDMIEKNQFDVAFQPIYDLNQDAIIGAETLLRTDDLIYGPLDLGLIIDVAEETGLIVELGDAIFRRACEECFSCDAVGPDRIVSVNVSVRQIRDPEFVQMLVYIMDDVGVQPRNVALEVTETMMMKNGTLMVDKLKYLQDIGMRIFIDDFGKGYSSMMQLRNLPADKLKIDMEFVRNLERDATDVEIVKGINNLAHSLNLITCAEGVETEGQMKILRSLGVDQIQGYIIGEPVPSDTFKCVHTPKTSLD